MDWTISISATEPERLYKRVKDIENIDSQSEKVPDELKNTILIGHCCDCRTVLNGVREQDKGFALYGNQIQWDMLNRISNALKELRDNPEFEPKKREELGRGVFKTRIERANFALKTLHASRLSNSSESDPVLVRLRHPNIVIHFHQLSKTIDFYEHLSVFMEFCDTDLSKMLHDNQKTLPDEEVRRLIKQMASALKYLLDCGIVHRDIKLGNIFIKWRSRPDGESITIYKLGDFGSMKHLSCESADISDAQLQQHHSVTIVGTTDGYRAPELQEAILKRTDGRTFDFSKIDAWSIGIVILKITSGFDPLQGDIESAIGSVVNHDIRRVLQGLLQIDPTKRRHLHELLEFP